jgi:hypothetical protein
MLAVGRFILFVIKLTFSEFNVENVYYNLYMYYFNAARKIVNLLS